jgi:hypothetical protein
LQEYQHIATNKLSLSFEEGNMVRRHRFRSLALYIASGLPLVLSSPAFADASGGSVSNVESFIKSIITVMAALAGLIATAYFVVGGFSYMTSAGNPERLERAKRTLFFSAAGLAVTIGAFVLSNIVTSLATNAFGS